MTGDPEAESPVGRHGVGRREDRQLRDIRFGLPQVSDRVVEQAPGMPLADFIGERLLNRGAAAEAGNGL